MSTPEITMDGPETNPEREPTRRSDLSALSWRARPGAKPNSPETKPDSTVDPDGWAPPEPWSPPAWTPPPAGVAEPAGAPDEPAQDEQAQDEQAQDEQAQDEQAQGEPVQFEPDVSEIEPTDSAPVTSVWAASVHEPAPAPSDAADGPEPVSGEPEPGEPEPVAWTPPPPAWAPIPSAWAAPAAAEIADVEVVDAEVVDAEVVDAEVAGAEVEPDLVEPDLVEADLADGYVAAPEVVDEPALAAPDPEPAPEPAPAADLGAAADFAEPESAEPEFAGPEPVEAEFVEAEFAEPESMVESEPEPEPVAESGPVVEPTPAWGAVAPLSALDPYVPAAAMAYPSPPSADLPPIEDILPRPHGWREVGFDTVTRAAATDDEFQPYPELGLQSDEYAKIRQILGRRPTESELAMYSIMWSEHCSYKSSKVHLRQFTEKAPASDRMLAGIGANAGVIKVSDTLAVTFKVESHNHPSFVEPYQGAATGVGGIVRDILAMGARPVAVMDPLRFGAPDHEDTKRVLPGVVSGIGGYGNCLGLPNIGGEVVFDACYQGNPLVNALCVGVLPVDRLQNKAATGPGNVVVLIGAKTGRDGIGGVSVLASATFGAGSETRRPSVQVGDPFMEKLLIEACLEIYDLNLVVGIQDLGGAGLTCALSETAAAGGTGMAINLDLVPLREPSMRPEEILASESQERMLLIVTPENLPVVLSLCARWGVLATAIGEVVAPDDADGGRLRIWWHGELIVDVPPGSLADDGPIYARPMREPFERELMKVDRAETLARPGTPAELRATLLRLISSPNLCDKSWVTEQYDRYVLGNTVLAQPEDSGVIRIDEATGLGIALAVDGNGRYARLDPYAGARLALAEAYRNVSVTGATPVAVTNCLNFGSPEDAGVMWQFAEAVRGLADGCQELGIPVTGGNVSFYNQTGGTPIHPTPIVGVLGLLTNVARRVPMGFSGEGDAIFLLGQTREELSGSEWAHVTHGHLGGSPPVVDFPAEQRLGAMLAEAVGKGLLTAAHDLSDGGLAQALVESCLRRNVGAHVGLPPDGQSAFVHLFSESTARVLVSVRKGQEQAFAALAGQRGVPYTALGIVAGTSLVFDDLFEIGLDELRQAHMATLPALFG